VVLRGWASGRRRKVLKGGGVCGARRGVGVPALRGRDSGGVQNKIESLCLDGLSLETVGFSGSTCQ